jgi:hypothetical protein
MKLSFVGVVLGFVLGVSSTVLATTDHFTINGDNQCDHYTMVVVATGEANAQGKRYPAMEVLLVPKCGRSA